METDSSGSSPLKRTTVRSAVLRGKSRFGRTQQYWARPGAGIRIVTGGRFGGLDILGERPGSGDCGSGLARYCVMM